MSKVYEGDNWKYAEDEPQKAVEKPRTRAEEQAHIDNLYGMKCMTREEWSRRTNELSNLYKRSAAGRIAK